MSEKLSLLAADDHAADSAAHADDHAADSAVHAARAPDSAYYAELGTGGALGLGYSYITSSPVDILFP
jgi:hypothetical protein